jgi:cullin-4
VGLALRTIGCWVAEKPKLPFNFEDITWAKIKEAVTAIHQKQPVSCSLEELYRAVEDLCLHKMAGNLYRRLQQECEVHIAAKLQLLVGQSPDVVVFLSQVESCWQDHCDQMLLIRSIALYLDRTYVIQNSGVLSLWDMGLQLFRCHLSVCPEVELKTVSGLLCLIEQER